MTTVGGVWAAVVTPVDDEFTPDVDRAVPYYRDLLERGCDGINLLGTTAEAMSFDARQRVGFMQAVAAGGLPMRRMMVGTGAAAPADAVRQTRCAFDCNFAAALVMPPFFFRDATDDGIVAFFDSLFAKTNPPRNSVLLYNFPRMSGITFHPDLVARLVAEFPGIIAGMKDSSNDARLQTEVLSRHPELAVLPGSESALVAAKARGAAGCISGSVALWPELARLVYAGDDTAEAERLNRARAALDGFPFIPAVRYLTASQRGDPGWERMTPPLTPLSSAQRDDLDRKIETVVTTSTP
ncbi:MAG: dihydrodipicolinate synthase family protein [Candidatus Eremiobacteraeota bacterium]|nr:dihydrodipicolinate synthase family protein [Candidatus Eremiobacteraeota bacterium]